MSGCRQHAQLSVEDTAKNFECVTVMEGAMQDVERLLPRIKKNMVGGTPLVQFGLCSEQLSERTFERRGGRPVEAESLPSV